MAEMTKAGKRNARPAAERLKDVAKELFYKQGIRATGVEELCRVAGTTKISLYRAYPSKDELIASVLRQDCEEETCWLDKAQEAGLTPAERPRAYVREAAQSMRENGYRGCPLGMAIVEFPDPDHPARQVADAYKRKVRSAIRQMLAEAGAADPEMTGDTLLLMIEGAFAAAPYLGHMAAADALERGALRLLDTVLPQEVAEAEVSKAQE